MEIISNKYTISGCKINKFGQIKKDVEFNRTYLCYNPIFSKSSIFFRKLCDLETNYVKLKFYISYN